MSKWQERAEIRQDVVYFPFRPFDEVSNEPMVYVWDLDKTYLDTKFESVRGLWRTIVEKGFQKRNVPGTGVLARSLQNSQQDQPGPLYFITASPPQLENRITDKLSLDGLQPYGIFCKDNLKNLRPKRLRRLAEQVGFKIQALMQLRAQLSENVRMILFGDDSESDAKIYSLFSDICARRMDKEELTRVLRSLHVTGTQSDVIFEIQEDLPENDPVEKIYINLETDTDADYYIKFGKRTFSSYNSYQMAMDLYQDGRLSIESVIDVARDLIMNYGFTTDQLEFSLDDVVRRQLLGDLSFSELSKAARENQLISDQFSPSIDPKKISRSEGKVVYELEGNFEPWIPERIDYLHDYR